MDDYLAKPFTRDQLATTLARWLPESAAAPAGATPAPSSAPPARTEPVPGVADEPINPRALETIRRLPGTDGTALAKKVISAYLADTPARLGQMQAAAGAGDAEALRKAAHGMKSSSANVGADRLAGLCKELEAIGRSGTVEGASRLLESAAAELERVVAALRVQLAERPESALS
jgi:HPt (histidine-containing phosphotransfer) domain-containing protein